MQPERKISRLDLFLAFMKIGMFGFGGVAPWARRVLVEERKWMTDEEFASLLGMGQILPGANVVNASVIFGDRQQGPIGSLLCFSGIMVPPLALLVAIAALYDRFESLPDVQAALSGMAAAGCGLILGTGLKIGSRLRREALTLALCAAAGVAVLLKAPLVAVVLVLVPVGLGCKLWAGRAA